MFVGVVMPRVRRTTGTAAGVRVPRLYAALLERERGKCARPPTLARPDDPGAGFFRRPRHLLDALEAGETVSVPRWLLGGHWMRAAGIVTELPWDRDQVRTVRVSPDDQVRPVREL
jgi:hypothetical protein